MLKKLTVSLDEMCRCDKEMETIEHVFDERDAGIND